MSDTCPTCGGAVTVHGKTTLHYGPDLDALADEAVETLLDTHADCQADCEEFMFGCSEGYYPCQALAHAILVDAWTR